MFEIKYKKDLNEVFFIFKELIIQRPASATIQYSLPNTSLSFRLPFYLVPKCPLHAWPLYSPLATDAS